MSSEDPLAGIELPKPALALRNETLTLRAESLKKLRLKLVKAHEKQIPKTQPARLNFVRRLLEEAAAELIQEAEKAIGASGAEKKQMVRDGLSQALRLLVSPLPDFLEPAAFGVLEAALDGIIETVFRQLVTRGAVNADA